MARSFVSSAGLLALSQLSLPLLTPLAAEEVSPKDTPRNLEWKMPRGMEDAFESPPDPKDAYGNPVRQGADEKTGWPLEIRHKATGMHLVFIPAGEFMMGSPENEKDRLSDEGPVHKVKIPKPFYLGKYEVTQAEWRKVTGNEPWEEGDDPIPTPSHAVSCVSWNDCQELIKKLNVGVASKALQRLGGAQRGAEAPHYELKFALPTEAQWEYACRAGTTTRFYYGDDADYSKLGDYAWAASAGVSAVGQKKPNVRGLYDMHGNVCEWCEDAYKESYEGASTDGSIAANDANDATRVLRGGSWLGYPRFCRAASRYCFTRTFVWYYCGVRLCVRDF
jgi:formylglycine-generating enzyme required for sulfatase activity